MRVRVLLQGLQHMLPIHLRYLYIRLQCLLTVSPMSHGHINRLRAGTALFHLGLRGLLMAGTPLCSLA